MINDNYEKPFRVYWFEQNALSAANSRKGAVLAGIDYEPFKLFHLSVLFRASASSHANFSEVQLGAHHERIGRMVLEKDAGEEQDYRIVCCAVENPEGEGVWDSLITPAHRVRTGSALGYYFVFAGAQWIYYVSSHVEPLLRGIHLKSNGTLPVVRLPLHSIKHYGSLSDQPG